MSYVSFEFLAFCVAILFVYYIFSAFGKYGRKAQKYVLLAASLAFYTWSKLYPGLKDGFTSDIVSGIFKSLSGILITAIVSFLAGVLIGGVWKREAKKLEACDDKEKQKTIKKKSKRLARLWLVLALLVTVGLLAVCKYNEFAVENINVILDKLGKGQLEAPDILLPMGISFYTFMAISYVLDIFWKRYDYEKNVFAYVSYITYFPHVVQGPIDRYNKFSAQMKDGVKFSYKNITFGAQLALWGFFEKLVVADRIGIFVNNIYGNVGEYKGIIIVLATVLYSVQIYADFAGCIDIVRGISEMFGITLEKNFNHPYFAKTMPEFWRRWHMSLMEWFKDYIYYPVSTSKLVRSVKKHTKKNRLKRFGELFATCFPALIVWMVTGIWHGAAWNFVAWGMFHACLIILGNIFERPLAALTKKLKINVESFSWKLWQMTRTFVLCCIGRVFFKAGTVKEAFFIFRQMFAKVELYRLLPAYLFTYGLNVYAFTVMLVSIFILWAVDMVEEKYPLRETLSRQNLVFRWLLIYACLAAILIFGVFGPEFNASAFIYEQF